MDGVGAGVDQPRQVGLVRKHLADRARCARSAARRPATPSPACSRRPARAARPSCRPCRCAGCRRRSTSACRPPRSGGAGRRPGARDGTSRGRGAAPRDRTSSADGHVTRISAFSARARHGPALAVEEVQRRRRSMSSPTASPALQRACASFCARRLHAASPSCADVRVDQRVGAERLDQLDLRRHGRRLAGRAHEHVLGPHADEAVGRQPCRRRLRTELGSALVSTTFICGVPMNCATNWFAGRSYSSSGEPTCSIAPSRSTTTRSASVIASTWSCVT